MELILLSRMEVYMFKTVLLILFWCGLVSFAMWLSIGMIPDGIIGFVGAVLMIVIICLILVSTKGRTIQQNTNKYVVDLTRNKNERNQKQMHKHLEKVNESNRKK